MAGVRAYIFFGLNIVRFLSIVSLILVFASSIFVIVTDVEAVNAFEAARQSGNVTAQDFADCEYIENSTVPNQIGGVFWAIINRLLIIFQVVILFLSEIGWPSPFFDRFFPVLGPGFGLGALGIFQGLIGAAVLSQHVDDFTLVSAFFLFVLGCINMFLGLLFRESAKSRRSITLWREGAKDVLPTNNPRPPTNLSRSSSGQTYTSSTVYDEKTRDVTEFGAMRNGSRAGYGFGRQGEKAAGLRGFLISKPLESRPRYAARPTSAPSRSSRSSSPEPESEPHFASSGSAI
ncbi:hypothetical protein BDR06DRAFT_989962 [Suillus hirtellus]|nr:hypothetical protein BDR06DRAFT_989962 [Suillus hirtellus]